MNKTILKNFAIDARNQLIEEIKNKAAMIGITEEGISSPLPASTSDLLLFDIQTVDPYILKGKEIRQYKRLVNELKQREENSDYDTAYETLIEEIAYTWFNRLIAIRFMEVNNYMPNRMRVLSSEIEGVNEPELVTNYLDSGLEFTQEELQQLAEWRLDGSARSMDQMFQLLFIKQANTLKENLPELFEKTDDYAELLLTISYNNPEGVLYKLIHEVPEEYFDVETENEYGQVEIIGWLYQYYNTEKKDEVFARPKSKKIPKEDIPAVTQLFTPDWIVQYMVQNSLGRLWIEKLLAEGDSRTEKEIAESFSWKYYIPEAEQELEVQELLVEIRADRKNLKLEEITFMDPAMGSYHIGVYAFDVFMQLYQSQGYSPRDAAELIVEKNLYGIDIDERAYQLSYFALMMKARQYNRRILTKDIKPNLSSIIESNPIDRNHLKYLGTNVEDKDEWKSTKEDIIEILDLFIDAKEYGSILKIDGEYNFEQIQEFISSIKKDTQMSFETIGIEQTQNDLLTIISTAESLSSKYDVVVTNPPYLASKGMNSTLRKYLSMNYGNSNRDMFSVFIEISKIFTKKNGFYAMITQHSWMFLSSFEKLRFELQSNNLINMLHLGTRAFEEISGDVVQTTSFVYRNNYLKNYKGSYIRLVEFTDTRTKQINVLKAIRDGDSRICYVTNQSNYNKIPGSPLAYWASKKIYNIFNDSITLNDISEVRKGMDTGNNSKYLRLWYEIGYHEMGNTNSDKRLKWNPYTKGGQFRKWYGNNDYVVYWKDQGTELRNNKRANIRSKHLYFNPSLTWTLISSDKNLALRYCPSGYIFDSNGSFIQDENNLQYIQGYLNSNVGRELIKYISSTMAFNISDIYNMPIIISEQYRIKVDKLVEETVKLSKNDWDSFENSWDFKHHPVLDKNIQSEPLNTLEESYKNWKEYSNSNFEQLKYNEEKLNEIFIDIYGLENELTPEVSDKDITITKIFDDKKDIYEDIKGNQYIQTKEDIVKSFISYAVGCMFGRYSLDEEGLIYAGGEWDDSKYETFKPVEDNVILITDDDYFEDDIVHRFVEFVEVVYGEETLEENLAFIADNLTGRGTPREKIRNYFMNNFYKDHCQQYSVRGSGKLPIYWMYDSSAGKTRRNSADGFKALVYMHRYDEDTTGKVRMDYLHKVQRAYEQKIDNLEYQINLTDSAREIADAEKEIEKLTKQLKELQDYDEKIGHLALSRIPIDLDDGVRVNYDKVQTDENGKKLKILAKR